jgi:hypothetical protein
MNFLKSDPANDMQRKLDDARERREKHNARLEAQLEQVGELSAELEQAAAAAAPDSALDNAAAKLEAARRRIDTLRTTIATSDREIADCEAKLAAIQDRNHRFETARKLEAWAADIAERAKEFYAACDKLREAVALASEVVPEAAGPASYLKNASGDELPPALELVVNLLRGGARSVLAGHGPSQLPAPPRLAAAQPQHAWVFATKPLKWIDEQGQLRRHPAYFEVMLPVSLAARAVEVGAAVDPKHQNAVAQKDAHRDFAFPDPAKCIDLNAGDPAPARETTRGNARANGPIPPVVAQTPQDRGQRQGGRL